MNKRNNTLDILRGIGIILVMIGHLRHMIPDDSPINLVIYSFHMPLFLVISGYLFAAKSEDNETENVLSIQYLKRKYASIIKPYFCFALLSLIYSLPNSQYSARDMLIGILAGGGGDVSRVGNIALWFLPMFFLATIIFSCIYSIYIYTHKYAKRWVLALLAVAVSLSGYVIIRDYSNYVFWSFDIALLVQIFFYVGFLFYGIEKRWAHNKVFSFLVMIISGIIWMAMIRINGRVDLNGRKIGNIFLYYIGGVSGTLFWYMVSKCFISYIPYVSGLLAWCGVYGKLEIQ